MDLILEKSLDRSRSMLFGFLLSCLFSEEVKSKCPLSLLRNNLTIEEKYNFVMEMSEEEIHAVLKLHTKCFEKRIFSLKPLQ